MGFKKWCSVAVRLMSLCVCATAGTSMPSQRVGDASAQSVRTHWASAFLGSWVGKDHDGRTVELRLTIAGDQARGSITIVSDMNGERVPVSEATLLVRLERSENGVFIRHALPSGPVLGRIRPAEQARELEYLAADGSEEIVFRRADETKMVNVRGEDSLDLSGDWILSTGDVIRIEKTNGQYVGKLLEVSDEARGAGFGSGDSVVRLRARDGNVFSAEVLLRGIDRASSVWDRTSISVVNDALFIGVVQSENAAVGRQAYANRRNSEDD